jgi:hypothetical protein
MHNFFINNKTLEKVNTYKYLCTIFQTSGCYSPSEALDAQYKKGLKAYFKLCKSFNTNFQNINTFLHIYDHAVVPVLLYGCEIWGKFDPKLEEYKKRIPSKFTLPLRIFKLTK